MTPETQALVERARNHKMTPYETFEQRVSFVFSGQSAKTKDEIRQQLFEQHGCPHSDYDRLAAEERAAIVHWLRDQAAMWERLSRQSEARGKEYAEIARSQVLMAASYADHADAIEQGLHHRAQALADLAEGDAELIGDSQAG